MSQRQWIVIIGAWTMIFLFLGFPSSLDKILALVTGLVLIAFAYRIRFREAAAPADTYSESAARGHIQPQSPVASASDGRHPVQA